MMSLRGVRELRFCLHTNRKRKSKLCIYYKVCVWTWRSQISERARKSVCVCVSGSRWPQYELIVKGQSLMVLLSLTVWFPLSRKTRSLNPLKSAHRLYVPCRDVRYVLDVDKKTKIIIWKKNPDTKEYLEKWWNGNRGERKKKRINLIWSCRK